MVDRIRFLSPEELAAAGLPGVEIDFARVELARTPTYLARRLDAIGFTEQSLVLDCACGVGHWATVAATLNRRVVGLDLNADRVRIANWMRGRNGLDNLWLLRGDMESLPFQTESFDAILCYGAFMFVRPRRTLVELVRVLKPGGRLYLNANGAGWYWVERIRQAWASHDPRRLMATIRVTARTLARRGLNRDLGSTFLGSGEVRRLFEAHGLDVIAVAGEGRTGPPGDLPPIYQGRYGPLEGVFELVAVKRGQA